MTSSRPAPLQTTSGTISCGARIVLAEDDADIASVVVDYLHHAGHTVEHFVSGAQALHRILAMPPDLVLLDIMLPDLDGLEVLRAARQHTTCPILLVTARVEEVDRLIGLELGADDYICKPFSPREVVARVRAVLRRTGAATLATDLCSNPHQGLVLDADQWLATLNGQALALTRREFRLLQALARQPGRILSRSQLLDLAYDDTLDVNERAIDSHIKNLRKKLKAVHPQGEDGIRSVYGVGFAYEQD